MAMSNLNPPAGIHPPIIQVRTSFRISDPSLSAPNLEYGMGRNYQVQAACNQFILHESISTVGEPSEALSYVGCGEAVSPAKRTIDSIPGSSIKLRRALIPRASNPHMTDGSTLNYGPAIENTQAYNTSKARVSSCGTLFKK